MEKLLTEDVVTKEAFVNFFCRLKEKSSMLSEYLVVSFY